MENRTDLALESYENQRKTVLPGVKVREQDGISVVEVLDARGEKALGKPVGKYITYRVSPMAQETQLFDGRLERIADLLRELLPDHPTGVLVAGVGNTAITADALGPETNRYVLATRHIAGELRRALGPLTDVSTVTTGVLGNTGMESAEVVAGMVHTVRPDCVLVVDALAASSADRLGTTVQLSNVGIAPGSGVGNHRREISARVLGVPVVALGIPTVVSSRVLGGTAEEMYVTPREIDQLINRGAKLLGMSINVCLQRHLQPRDLYTLVSAAPRISAVGAVGQRVAAVFSPTYFSSKINTEFSTIKSAQTTHTKTTATREAQAMHPISGKDSDPYAHITETPEDVAKLMQQEKKVIGSQKQVGKTSEESYQGGGTILSFGSLAIQSKIPASFYRPDIEALLKQKAALSVPNAAKPTVLIYHSHTTEGYTLLDAGYYTKSTDLRSDSSTQNMVRVGDELCAYLEKCGIGVVHDRTTHDKDYSGAYDHSRKTVAGYLEKYPSIEITIDVHRDDITYDNKTKVKPTAKIKGKKAARMMIIAGCEYNRVKNFPDWEYNLRFDLAVQQQVEKQYPGLMRPILFSERKYNMDMTRNSFLLEVGTDGNTLDEACYSARLFATALARVIQDYEK